MRGTNKVAARSRAISAKRVAAVAFAILFACGGDEAEHSAGGGSTSEVVLFRTTAAPFEGFSHDTGPVPSTGPAQLSMGIHARGDLTIEGKGRLSDGTLVGQPRSGKLSLDAGFALEGSLKVDVGVQKYDGDLPGLKDISIPLTGDVSFDPFLLDGESEELTVHVPETKLPPIPIGAFPGKLQLTVSNESVVRLVFSGACVEVAGGVATWRGAVAPGGTLVLKGTVQVDLPGVSPVDLGEIPLPVTVDAKRVDVGATGPVKIGNSTQGQCDAAPVNGTDDPLDASRPDGPDAQEDPVGKQCGGPDSECSKEGQSCTEGKCLAKGCCCSESRLCRSGSFPICCPAGQVCKTSTGECGPP